MVYSQERPEIFGHFIMRNDIYQRTPETGSPHSKGLADPEKTGRDSLDSAATRFSLTLGREFERKFPENEVSFDIRGFKSRLVSAVEKVFLDPSIPEIAKKKFESDLLAKIELLAKVEFADIENLRNRRAVESLGIEPVELERKFGKDEAKKRGYYLGKILGETIGNYVEPAALGLVSAFSDEKRKVGTTEYHANTLDAFRGKIGTLDAKYGVDIGSEIEGIARDFKKNASGDISREDLYREAGTRLVRQLDARQRIPQANRILELIRNGTLTERAKFGKQTEAGTPNGPKDAVDIVLEYRTAILTFQKTETEIRTAKDVAVATGPVATAKQWLGMDRIKNEFDSLRPESIDMKIRNASLSDMVIMAVQLSQLSPIVGDIGGGLEGIANAYSGTNVNGAMLTGAERSVNAALGVLGIAVVGGFAKRAHDAGRLPEILKSFRALQKYLPEKLAEFAKSGENLPKSAISRLESLFPSTKPVYFIPEAQISEKATGKLQTSAWFEQMKAKKQ
jgi:hypothetical protein